MDLRKPSQTCFLERSVPPARVEVKNCSPVFPELSSGWVSRPYPTSGHIQGVPKYLYPVPHGWAQRRHACRLETEAQGLLMPEAQVIWPPTPGLCPICQPDFLERPLPTSRKNRACFELEIGGVSCSVLLRHCL